MIMNSTQLWSAVGTLTASVLFGTTVLAETDPLPSWNDGDTKNAIIAFVENVTDEGSDSFVEKDERIATFDNDGTLWVEQPMYTQLAFAFDRVKAMVDDHLEWKPPSPFRRSSKAT